MLKLIYCYRRKADLPVGDFQRRLAENRAAQLNGIPGLARYEQNLVKPTAYDRQPQPIFDAVEKFWIETPLSPSDLLDSQPIRAAQAALADIVDAAATRHIFAREAIIKDGLRRDGMLRLIEFLTRKPGMGTADFHTHWEDVHGPLVARQPQVERYVQSHTLDSEYEGRMPDFDGVTEVWFADSAAMREAVAAPIWAEVLVDEDNFVPKNTPFILSIDRTVEVAKS